MPHSAYAAIRQKGPPTLLRFPLVERRARDPVTPADFFGLGAGLVLPQHPDDLLFAESRSFRRRLLFQATDSTSIWRSFSGGRPATLITDVAFSCSALHTDQELSQYVRTYTYEFADENAPSIFPPVSFPQGAEHFSEVQYLFNLSAFGEPTVPFTASQRRLSNTMIRYWTDFATSGDPNSINRGRRFGQDFPGDRLRRSSCHWCRPLRWPNPPSPRITNAASGRRSSRNLMVVSGSLRKSTRRRRESYMYNPLCGKENLRWLAVMSLNSRAPDRPG